MPGWLALYLGSLAAGLVSRRHMFGWFTPPSRNGVSEEPFDRGRRPARHDPPRPGRSPVRPGKGWREACRTTAEGGGLPVGRAGGPDRLRGGERGPGCAVPVCCHRGSAL